MVLERTLPYLLYWVHYVTMKKVVCFRGQFLMKVCIAKPGSCAVLQFDCRVSGENESIFSIQKAFYHEDFNSLSSSKYRGPPYDSLDPELQKGFRRFLWVRGVDTQLSNFLLVHLHKKQQSQYVKWLQNLESMMARNLER